MPGGRPSKYNGDETNKIAYKLTLLGADDQKLANFFEVKEQTINNWKKDYPEFFESIKKGKDFADANVAKSLYNRACGFTKKQVKIFQYQGYPVVVDYDEYYPPDTAAAFIWLKNRQPQLWRDKKEDDDPTIPKTVDFNFTIIDASKS